jgi:putative addiction module component (TIGR02574 family)
LPASQVGNQRAFIASPRLAAHPPRPFPPSEGLAVGEIRQYPSFMIEALEVERMSPVERVQAMEILWRSMAAASEKVESPAWHKKVLEKRLAKVEAGRGEFLTVSQLKRRLAKRKA